MRIEAVASQQPVSGYRTSDAARTVRSIERVLLAGERMVLVASTLALIVLMLMQILARTRLNLPVTIADELCRALLMWLIFIGAAHGVYRGEHFAVEIFMEKLRFPGKRIVAAVTAAITLAFLIALLWISIVATVKARVQSLPMLDVSVAWAYASMPVGISLMIVHSIVLAVFGPRDPQSRLVADVE